MSAFLTWSTGLFTNPILARELRLRSRARAFTVVVTAELLALAILLTILWVTVGSGVQRDELSTVGALMFWSCVGVINLIIVLSVPATSGQSIAGERERDTLALLLTSALTTGQIIIGKVLASVVGVVFTILAAMPVLAICYAIGGVSLWAVMISVVLLTWTAFVVSSVSILASTHASTSSRGITMAYTYAVLTPIVASCIPLIGWLSYLVIPFVAIAMSKTQLETRI